MQLTRAQHKALQSQLPASSSVTDATPGELIYSSKDCTGQLLIVESGTIRLIDPQKTFGSYTLAKVNGPYILGISQLLGLPFAEEARASVACQYRLIDLSEASSNAIQNLSTILVSSINAHEHAFLVSSLGGLHIAVDRSTLKLSTWVTHCELYKRDQPSTGNILVYLDCPRDGFVYGQQITKEIIHTFFSASSLPRIASIRAYDIARSQPETPLALNQNQVIEDGFSSLPLTPELVSELNSTSDDGFKFIRGSSRRDAFAASIAMLVAHFQLPTRRDTISRAAALLDHDDIRWTIRLNAILDELGLATRIIRVKTDAPSRLPIPAVWISTDGNCCLITKTTTSELTLIDPTIGRRALSMDEARALFNEQAEVVAVDVGLHTPQKRFGIFWLLPYVKRYRLQLIEVFSASFLNQLFALATPLLFQQIIDRVISKGAFDALGPLVILMLIFTILETIFGSLRTFQFVEVSNRIDIGVGSAIISRLLRIHARFFDKRPVGELSSRLGELENIRQFLTGTALTVVLDAFFSLLYFGVMLFYSPLLTLIVLLTLPFLFGVTLGVTPITQRLIRKRAEAASRTQSLLVEILGGIQTVKLQNAELTAKRQWEDRHLDSINQGFKAVLANTTSSNVLQLISKVSNILIIGVGAWLVLQNQLTLGQLIAFRIISGYVTQPMLRLASTWQSFQEASLSLERVGDVVNQPLEVSESEESNIVMPELRGEVTADALSYTYTSTSAPVLSSVSLQIDAGSFVGLVGQSGCGKSTLLKMVPRLYRPSSGKLLIDQYDIMKVDLYSLRSQIGFVPQDCLLFEGTVYSNIALGDPQAESERVVAMAQIACAHEFIMDLPYGYSTPVGEKGAGLSGGQRQRIALARMLLENPRMVVLDEATSALDVDTERQVVSNLRAHLAGRTLLMITHRLSTLIDADQIIVMHSGRIDEIGNHDNLMKRRGRYFALYQSQFGDS